MVKHAIAIVLAALLAGGCTPSCLVQGTADERSTAKHPAHLRVGGGMRCALRFDLPV